ncbi:MAG: end-binding protein Ku, partial [Micromonosporaceae bacterium]|nr:end-binding protein Ku [Micromonosporaceae bacterium]
DALTESGKVGIVKVAIRNREQLATLRVRDGVIVMATMIWPDEIREPSFAFLDQDVTLRPQERQMAESLVESMAGDFEPEQFTDNYREALQEVIEAKIEGREVVEPEEAQPTAGKVVDLMSALRASVEAAKRGRGEGSAGVSSTAMSAGGTTPAVKAAKSAARKAPQKPEVSKAPASRAAAKKAAGKTPAKKAVVAKAAAKKAAAAKKTPVRKSA